LKKSPLKLAREAVTPKLSHRRAADALGVGATTIYRQEQPNFDPAVLSVVELEARATLYGCSINRLLGREQQSLASDFATA
jgi:hypothetical protein